MSAFALVAHWLACIWYAIGFAERSGPKAHIGWLAGLANATDQPYTANNTGGPSIKVSFMAGPGYLVWHIETCGGWVLIYGLE